MVNPVFSVPDNICADGRIEIFEADSGRRDAELVIPDRPLGRRACPIGCGFQPAVRQQNKSVKIWNDDRCRADRIRVNAPIDGDRRRRASGRKDSDIISGSSH